MSTEEESEERSKEEAERKAESSDEVSGDRDGVESPRGKAARRAEMPAEVHSGAGTKGTEIWKKERAKESGRPKERARDERHRGWVGQR